MRLWDTIYKKLTNKTRNNEFIDIRYISKWVKLYPDLFPKFVVNNNYIIKFNSNKLRYEFYRK